MDETRREGAIALISHCAHELSRLMVEREKHTEIAFDKADYAAWAMPALQQPGMVGRVPANEIPKALYGAENDPVAVVTTWKTLTEMMLGSAPGGDIRDLIVTRYPDLPVLSLSGNFTHTRSRLALAQFLLASSWNCGTLTVRRESVTLTIDRFRCGLDGLAIDCGNVHRRASGRAPESYFNFLRSPIGRPRAARHATAGAARYLVELLPHLAREINLVFAAAVHLGCERQATDWFEMVEAPVPDIVDPAVWDQCTDIILATESNPAPALYSVLRAVIGAQVFYDLFGNPHRPVACKYTESLRKKHLVTIDEFRKGHLRTAPVKQTGAEKAAAVHSLLELQNLIR